MAAPSPPNPDPSFNTPVTLFAKDATGGTLVLSLPLNAFVYDFRVAFAKAFADKHDPNPVTKPKTESFITRTAVFVFGGQQLENMRRLYEYGIRKETTIAQIVRMGPQRNDRNLPNPHLPAPFHLRRPTFANLKNIGATRRRINTLMQGRKNLPEELAVRLGQEASQFAVPVHRHFGKLTNAQLKAQAVEAFLRENPTPTVALLKKTFSNTNFTKFPALKTALNAAIAREPAPMPSLGRWALLRAQAEGVHPWAATSLSAVNALRALSGTGALAPHPRALALPRLAEAQPMLLPLPGQTASLAELPQGPPRMMMRMATGGPPGQPKRRSRKSHRKTRRSS